MHQKKQLKMWLIIIFISISILIIISTFINVKENDTYTETWEFPIIPHPQEIYLSEKSRYFKMNKETQILVDDFTDEADSADIDLLNKSFQRQGLNPLKTMFVSNRLDTSNTIIILKNIRDKHVLENFILLKVFEFTEKYPGPEGYLLHIAPNYVLLAGNDVVGRYYGIQSLIQLILKDEETGSPQFKPVTIVDYPDMPLRCAFHGFYLNAMEDDSLIQRAYRDFKKISRFKFNMIDLASHHYGHLEMGVPGHPQEKLWQRFNRLHQEARRYHLRPRIGGWAKWVNTHSPWGADLTTLECIRTSQKIIMEGTKAYALKISNGQDAPNVIFNLATGKSWDKEPVIVTNESGTILYKEDKDYVVNFGNIKSEDYRKYYDTPQTHLQVLFNQVHYGKGEPEGYTLRWGETFNSPTTVQRQTRSRIQEGQKVKVTFSYIGPDPWSLIKVRYCRSDKRLHTDGPQNYIWRWCTDPIRLWGADDFSFDVDETRIFAWDKRCMDSGKSRSRIWADDIRYYYQTIRKANPIARISMWSDMLDPAHNAIIYKTEEIASIIEEYEMTDIIMIPWKNRIASESVRFFAAHDFPVMPSCQGWTDEGISDAPKWAHWVRQYYGEKNIPSGLMHCSWEYGFDSEITLERLATVADHAWSVAPYILHTPVKSAIEGKSVKIAARFEGDKFVFDGITIRHGPLSLKNVFLYYRTYAQSSFRQIKMKGSKDDYLAIIPKAEVKGEFIEYYISMADKFNKTYCPKLAESRPFRIKIIENLSFGI